jgi:hypothetical protein
MKMPLKWVFQERTAAILVDGLMVKAKLSRMHNTWRLKTSVPYVVMGCCFFKPSAYNREHSFSWIMYLC